MGSDISSITEYEDENDQLQIGFASQQVEQVKKYFKRMCGKTQDVLDLEQFIKENQLVPAVGTKIFQQLFDLDQNLQIEFYEFLCMVAQLNSSDLKTKASMLFPIFAEDVKQPGSSESKKLVSRKGFVSLIQVLVNQINKEDGKPALDDDKIDKRYKDLISKYFVTPTDNMDIIKFQKVFMDEVLVHQGLFSFGLISKWGGGKDIEEFDPDLSNEKSKFLEGKDDRIEAIKNGVEMLDPEQEQAAQAQNEPQNQKQREWQTVVSGMQPSNYKKKLANPPPCQLEIDYVYGFRCNDTRNNIHISELGQKECLVYHQASMCIVMDIETKSQQYFMEHNDDISCMDVFNDPSGKFSLVASGQFGSFPLLCVWKLPEMTLQVGLKGLLQDGIQDTCFNSSGTMVAACANDENHTIAIFDIAKCIEAQQNANTDPSAGVIASGKNTKEQVWQMRFTYDDKVLVVACQYEVGFFTYLSGSLRKTKGVVDPTSAVQSALCVGTLEQTQLVFTGMFLGNIYVWDQAKQVDAIKAHSGPLNTICERIHKSKPGFITSGNDGDIIVWLFNTKTQKLQKEAQINLENYQSLLKSEKFTMLSTKVSAISETATAKLIVGTRSSDIFQIDVSKGFDCYKSGKAGYPKDNIQCLLKGHFDGKLGALCMHPSKPYFYTSGQDKMIAKWDMISKTQDKSKILNISSECLSISKNAKWLIAGTNNGEILFFNPDTLQEIQGQKLSIVDPRLRFQGLHIEGLYFSPNDDMIAAAYNAYDGRFLLLFSVDKTGWNSQSYRKFDFKNPVDRMDFSKDQKCLRCDVKKTQRIIFLNIDQSKNNIQELNPQEVQLKDVQWESHHCLFTWESQGVWPSYSEGGDVNTMDLDQTGRILATGDDYSKLKLYLYPCCEVKAGNLRYSGHGSDVSNVKFSTDNNYIISLGGKERSIIQWKMTIDEEQFKQLEAKNKQFQQEDLMNQQKKNEPSLFEEEDQGKGDQALAVKTFIFKDPTGFKRNPKKDNQLPNTSLKLLHAHGYRSFYIDDVTRNMCKYVNLQPAAGSGKGGERNQIAFATAAVGVVMDLDEESRYQQSFFQKHEEDIVCLAVHPKRQIVATGQMAAKGKAKLIDIFVWDAQTKEIKCHINDFHRRAILYLDFSPDGRLLLSVGQDDDNSIAIHDWINKRMVCNSKVDKSKVNALSWKSANQFMTCGVRHIKFWQLNGQNLNYKEGSFGGGSFVAQTCGIYLTTGDVCVTGSADGNIYSWQGSKASKPIKAHDKSVQSVIQVSENQVMSGGFDGKVVLWNVKGSQLTKGVIVADVQQVQQQFSCGVVSLDVIQRNGQQRLLVATNGCEIYEGALTKNMQCQNLENYMQGHFEGELWGCAVNVSNPRLFVTSGDDKTIRLWDISEKKMLAFVKLEKEVRAIDWSQDGKFLVAADNVATIFSLNPQTLEVIHTTPTQFSKLPAPSRGTKWVEDIKISPDCKRVAFGAHGGVSHLELWELSGNGQFVNQKVIGTKVVGITSALLHLDWDINSQIVVLNSQAYELKYIDVVNTKAISDSDAKDLQYFTWTCKIGWCVQGIFQGVDYSDVNTVCRSNSKMYMATGDDFGKVNLFKYPVVTKKQVHQEYIGHSSHVTRVRFTGDDQYIVTTGGNDKSVLVWQVGDLAQAQQQKQAQSKKMKTMKTVISAEDQNMDEEQLQNLENAMGDVGIVKEKQKKEKKKQVKQYNTSNEDTQLFEEESPEDGDEFMAVKPWLGAIKEPTDWKQQGLDPVKLGKAPTIQPTLYHVFGLRSKDTRNNVRYLSNGFIVYHAAALGIVMEPETKQQYFFTGHIDDITSFAMHPNAMHVATGEIGPKPNIFIWDAVALTQGKLDKVINFKSPLLKGICDLAFSPSGKRLVAAAIDVDHNIAVFNVDVVKGQGSLLAATKSGPNLIISLSFVTEDIFAAGGVKYYCQWSINNNALAAKKGQFGQDQANTVVCSVTAHKNLCYCGTNTGTLLVFNGTAISKQVAAHESAIISTAVFNEQLLTGSKNGKIKIWSLDLAPENAQEISQVLPIYPIDNKFNVNGFSNYYASGVTSVCLSKDQLTLLVGTYSSEIHEIKRSSAQVPFSNFKLEAPKGPGQKKDSKKQQDQFQQRVLMKGHYTPLQKFMNEVWGLSLVPDNADQFMTCSDDGTIRLWSIQEKQQVAMAETTYNLSFKENQQKKKVALLDLCPKDQKTGDPDESTKARQLCVVSSSDILVGMKDGTVKRYELDPNTKEFRFSKAVKLSPEEISDIKVSPDQKMVCIGSHDNAIYALSYPDMKQILRPMKKHSSYITHIDFSVDGQALHSNCGAYELLFWDLKTGKQVTSGATAYRDEAWATWTCVLGWPVEGIWPPCADGTDINSVDRSHSKYNLDPKNQKQKVHVVATADDFGTLKLFNYPCLKQKQVPGKQSRNSSAGAEYTLGCGHSSHVTNVRWTNDDKFIITTGGEDQCIIIWKVDKADPQMQTALQSKKKK